MIRWISQVAASLFFAAVIGVLISGTAGHSGDPLVTQVVLATTTTVAPTSTETPSTTEAATTTAPTTTEAPAEVTTSTTSEAPTTTAAPTTTTEPVNEEEVLAASYPWGPSAEAAVLQTVLGIGADGWYGAGTRAAHLAELAARGMSENNVPPVPTTTAPPATTPPPTTTPDSGYPDLTHLPQSTLDAAATLLGECVRDGDLSDCSQSVLDQIEAVLAMLGA